MIKGHIKPFLKDLVVGAAIRDGEGNNIARQFRTKVNITDLEIVKATINNINSKVNSHNVQINNFRIRFEHTPTFDDINKVYASISEVAAKCENKVDITAFNSAITKVDNELNKVKLSVDSAYQNAEKAIGLARDAKSIAEGRNRAFVFPTKVDMYTFMQDVNNLSKIKVGDNFYIVDVEVPDYWVSKLHTSAEYEETHYICEVQPLEGEKVDLTEYVKNTDFNDKVIELKRDIAAASRIAEEAMDELLGKQDTLTAGTNITIENNVISAKGGGDADDITYTEKTKVVDHTAGSAGRKIASIEFTANAALQLASDTDDSLLEVKGDLENLAEKERIDFESLLTKETTVNTFSDFSKKYTLNGADVTKTRNTLLQLGVTKDNVILKQISTFSRVNGWSGPRWLRIYKVINNNNLTLIYKSSNSVNVQPSSVDGANEFVFDLVPVGADFNLNKTDVVVIGFTETENASSFVKTGTPVIMDVPGASSDTAISYPTVVSSFTTCYKIKYAYKEENSNVFIAEYDVTDFNTIKEAYDNGKQCICKVLGSAWGDPIYYYLQRYEPEIDNVRNSAYFYFVMEDEGFNNSVVRIDKYGTWHRFETKTAEVKGNKEQTLTETSTIKYPSSKAVATYVSNQKFAKQSDLETKADKDELLKYMLKSAYIDDEGYLVIGEEINLNK